MVDTPSACWALAMAAMSASAAFAHHSSGLAPFEGGRLPELVDGVDASDMTTEAARGRTPRWKASAERPIEAKTSARCMIAIKVDFRVGGPFANHH